MSSKDISFLIKVFLSWKILLFVFLFLAIPIVPLQMDFLGGGLSNYLKAPYLWSWINFDGEHYLSIAYRGYQPLTYFYFPLYPLIVRYITSFFSHGYNTLALFGLLISNLSFIFALFGLWKLTAMDYKKEVVVLVTILLLLFPTSFYFGSFYTESTFLLLAVWSFYFARKGHWVLAGALGGLASATRIIGLALLPALAAELLLQKKEKKKINYFFGLTGVLLVPLGLLAYMWFLKMRTGDPLEFLHNLSIFGQQRSSALILLPQVFYRYIFKILPSINYNYFPVVFSTLLEFLVALCFFVLSVLSFFRIRFSLAIYLAGAFLIPTLSGSFSSLPRYALVAFPAFILAATYLSKAPRLVKAFFYILLITCLAIGTAFFVRGYWVA